MGRGCSRWIFSAWTSLTTPLSSPFHLIKLWGNPSSYSTWLLPAPGFRCQIFGAGTSWGSADFRVQSSPRPVAITSSAFNPSPAKRFKNSFLMSIVFSRVLLNFFTQKRPGPEFLQRFSRNSRTGLERGKKGKKKLGLCPQRLSC